MISTPLSNATTPRHRLIEQIADYDRLMWGERLDAAEEQALRTLAQVFDLDSSGLSLVKLWSQLRPLVAENAVRA